MKINLDSKKKYELSTILVCLCAVAVLAVTLFAYTNSLHTHFQQEIYSSFRELSAQSTVSLQKEIRGKQDVLTEIAARIGAEKDFSPQTAPRVLKDVQERYQFKRVGVIAPDGTAYTTDDLVMYLGDRLYFMDSMSGSTTLSNTFNDKSDGEAINVYSTPIYHNGEISGVLFATFSSDYFRDVLSVSFFGGEGYSYIVNSKGNAILDSSHSTSFRNLQNIYFSILDADISNTKAAAQLREIIENGRSGVVVFHNQVDKYLYASPLQINDWYLLSVVPVSVVNANMVQTLRSTVLLIIVLFSVFLLLMLYTIISMAYNKKELVRIAYVDSLTGGYSYPRFRLEAQKRLQHLRPGVTAVISMDIDGFKLFNDVFGYESANNILKFIWEQIRLCSTESDIFARQTADHFVILLTCPDLETLKDRLHTLSQKVQSYELLNQSHQTLSLSMGIYVLDVPGRNIDSAVEYANIARETIKNNRDTVYTFYDENIRSRRLQEKEIENQMHKGLENREFVAYFQPKFEASTKALHGAEALVRWKKEDGTIVPPGDFIPVFEKNGFVLSLDDYMFETVCRKQRELLDAGKPIVPISVNLSRRHLYKPDFVEQYTALLAKYNLPFRCVQLEITESAVFENIDVLCQILEDLHQRGFTILMDDFGTGFSSMMMLKTVPIDILKLDKSFVDDIGDPRGEKIIESIVALSHSLHIRVTAEGVETEEQYEFLKELGCDSIQGYYFARPMPEEQFEALLKNSQMFQ